MVTGRAVMVMVTRRLAVVAVVIEVIDLFPKFGIILTFVLVCKSSRDRGTWVVLREVKVVVVVA